MNGREYDADLLNRQTVWQESRLISEINKLDAWKLDDRRVFYPIAVLFHLESNEASVHDAKLVWKSNQVIVLQTLFPILIGEHVRVELTGDDSVTTLWGVVSEGRAGSRQKDKLLGIHIQWLRVVSECVNAYPR